MRDDGRLPFRVRIGVTGHRQLDDVEGVTSRIDAQLAKIRDQLFAPSSRRTTVVFTIISALAEGADRIVVQRAFEVLKDRSIELEAVLPLKVTDYQADFATKASLAEFNEMCGLAVQQIDLSEPDTTREQAYERGGRHIVDHCDVLLAVWDGRLPRGRGGTAEIVDYAQAQGVPVVIAHASEPWEPDELPTPGVELPGEMSRYKTAMSRMDEYNRLSESRHHLVDMIRYEERRIGSSLEGSSIHWQYRRVANWMLPHYVRADLLAVRWQRWYNRLARAVHYLAALAVTVVAAQVVWRPGEPAWLLLEVFFVSLLLLFVWAGRAFQVHDRWVDYRSLAEALRSSLFLVLTGIGPAEDQAETRVVGETNQPWFQRAFSEAWRRRPDVDYDVVNAHELRRFLAHAWIAEQIRYHTDAAQRYRRKRMMYVRLITGASLLAVTVALLHALSLINSNAVSKLFVFLAITLPAWGAALAGLREQGQYRLHEERSHATARRLERIRDQLERKETLDEVRQAAAQTQDVIVGENLDWTGVIEFQDLEVVV